MEQITKKISVFILLTLLVVALSGCTASEPDPDPDPNGGNNPPPEPVVSEELAGLLPEEEGYEWVYNGFAEYGHIMSLDSITESEGKRTYRISGEVSDPSGGEAEQDFSLTVSYVVDEDSLVQVKTEEAMLDSKFDQLTLLKTPLTVGTSWQEQVTDKEGNQATISGKITEVKEEDAKKIYTVRYEEQNSAYWEERVIKEGAGIQSFERLMDLGDEPFTVGYYLFVPSSGPGPEPEPEPEPEPDPYEYSLSLYFPLSDGSGVRQEKRVVTMTDLGVAGRAINELIAGPQTASLGRAVPEETELLGIRIEDGICYVDFSSEIRDNHWGGTTGESLTIAAIVNTLTEFSSVNEVQILIEGQTGASIAGHVELSEPIGRMSGMIK
ncbi:MAG: GerMN domain-containing protein [Bacillota bacterium]|nr:GerMN domain-containing protein [Bacillota bacterium]